MTEEIKYKKITSPITGKENTFKKIIRESQPIQEDTQEGTYKQDSETGLIDPAGTHYPTVNRA